MTNDDREGFFFFFGGCGRSRRVGIAQLGETRSGTALT
jgi:hypothetical protein